MGLRREAPILETNPGLGTYLVWGRGLPSSGEVLGLLGLLGLSGIVRVIRDVRVIRVIRVVRVCKGY